MAFDLPNNSAKTRDGAAGGKGEQSAADFNISPEPVIPEGRGVAQIFATDEDGLPLSYGTETLWLMPRDPHSLFAYWDIDWLAAFGEESPRPRKVQLRILDGKGAEQTSLEVEPMAGNVAVQVPAADASYQGEIGFFDGSGEWKMVSRSEAIRVPAKNESGYALNNFATIPLHLSFQRMIDATRATQPEEASLTATLSALRERVATETSSEYTPQEREVVQAVNEAAARQAQPPSGSALPDLWKQHRLEGILGFGNSSLNGGFGGSSRGR